MDMRRKVILKALNLDLVNADCLFSVAPTEDPTVARVHLNKYHVRDLVPVSRVNKRCTSKHTLINNTVELLHRRPLAELV